MFTIPKSSVVMVMTLCVILSGRSLSFSLSSLYSRSMGQQLPQEQKNQETSEQKHSLSITPTLSRKQLLDVMITTTSASLVGAVTKPLAAKAEEGEIIEDEATNSSAESSTNSSPAPTKSISPCVKSSGGKSTNCVSTASVRQLDLYAPPWTFNVSPEEAMARLKGIIDSDSTLERVAGGNAENPYYMKVRTTRNTIFVNEIEFVINPVDKVIFFKSEDVGDNAGNVSDFGAIRKQLQSIQQRSNGVFGTMGDNLNTADIAPKQNGPLGQLKAFYGYQSGKGFEDVFLDED